MLFLFCVLGEEILISVMGRQTLLFLTRFFVFACWGEKQLIFFVLGKQKLFFLPFFFLCMRGGGGPIVFFCLGKIKHIVLNQFLSCVLSCFFFVCWGEKILIVCVVETKILIFCPSKFFSFVCAGGENLDFCYGKTNTIVSTLFFLLLRAGGRNN